MLAGLSARRILAPAGPALARAEAALGHLHTPIPLDVAAAEARLDEMTGAIA